MTQPNFRATLLSFQSVGWERLPLGRGSGKHNPKKEWGLNKKYMRKKKERLWLKVTKKQNQFPRIYFSLKRNIRKLCRVMYFSHTTMYQIKISYNHRVHSGSDNKNVTQSLPQAAASTANAQPRPKSERWHHCWHRPRASSWAVRYFLSKYPTISNSKSWGKSPWWGNFIAHS